MAEIERFATLRLTPARLVTEVVTEAPGTAGFDRSHSGSRPADLTAIAGKAGVTRHRPDTHPCEFKSHLPAFASSRHLPVCRARGPPSPHLRSEWPASYAVAVERCEMALCDAVDACLPGTVR